MTNQQLQKIYESQQMSLIELANYINYDDNISYEEYKELPGYGSLEKAKILIKSWKKLKYEIY